MPLDWLHMGYTAPSGYVIWTTVRLPTMSSFRHGFWQRCGWFLQSLSFVFVMCSLYAKIYHRCARLRHIQIILHFGLLWKRSPSNPFRPKSLDRESNSGGNGVCVAAFGTWKSMSVLGEISNCEICGSLHNYWQKWPIIVRERLFCTINWPTSQKASQPCPRSLFHQAGRTGSGGYPAFSGWGAGGRARPRQGWRRVFDDR